MTLGELRPFLHVHDDNRDWVPYRTSYYSRTWGFCLASRTLDELNDDALYEVVVDSTLAPGSLTYGECFLPGERGDEVLLSTHVCHPSLANDNLSGVALLTELAAVLASRPRRLSYRMLFVPGTIGSIAWLARNEGRLDGVIGRPRRRLRGRLRAADVQAEPARGTRSSTAPARTSWAARGGRVLDFVPWGWDERQYNSPGFDLPVGCLTRSLEGEFPEYHSSADDLELIRPERLEQSLHAVLEILDVLEHDNTLMNLSPKGEPQLGKRGLYRATGGGAAGDAQLAMLWVLNQSDGSHSLLEIAERSGLPFEAIREAADWLRDVGLLAERGGDE